MVIKWKSIEDQLESHQQVAGKLVHVSCNECFMEVGGAYFWPENSSWVKIIRTIKSQLRTDLSDQIKRPILNVHILNRVISNV